MLAKVGFVSFGSKRGCSAVATGNRYKLERAIDMTAPLRASTAFIVIHTSATRYGVHVNDNDFYRWHVVEHGWPRVGYCYVIYPDGRVWQVHDDDRTYCNHVKGFNNVALGICLVGGLDRSTAKPDNQYTSMQMIALKQLVERLLKKYPQAQVTGHRDLSPDLNKDGVIQSNEYLKECPCFNAPSWARFYGFPAYGMEAVPDWKPEDNGLQVESDLKDWADYHNKPVWTIHNGDVPSIYKNKELQFTAASKWSAERAVKILNEYESRLQNKD